MEREEIVGLQMRVQYLEDHILQLDKVILGQGESIDTLEKKQKVLLDKMQDLSIQLEQSSLPENETPPHY